MGEMRLKGPWSRDRTRAFLREARFPLRIACLGAKGHPVLGSLWFVPEGDALWCATPQAARIAAHLARDGRCAFEVANDAPPYRGVRGQGIAALHPERGEEILRTAILRYLGDARSEFARWLLTRTARETAIAIRPDTLVSWDFTERMRDAIR